MKLIEYAEKINLLVEEYPNVTVVFASDEEGNSFEELGFDPCTGYFDGEEFDSESDEVNAVCVN